MNLLDKLDIGKTDIAFFCVLILLCVIVYPLVSVMRTQQAVNTPDAWQAYAEMYDCQIVEVIPGKVTHGTGMISNGKTTFFIPTTSRQPDEAKWSCANGENFVRAYKGEK